MKKLPPDLVKENEKIIGELKAGRIVKSRPPLLNPLFRESVQPYLIFWFKYSDPSLPVSEELVNGVPKFIKSTQ